MPKESLYPEDHNPLNFIIPKTQIRTFVGHPTDFTECDLEFILGENPPLRRFDHILSNPHADPPAGYKHFGSFSGGVEH